MANSNPLVGQLTAKTKSLEAELKQVRQALQSRGGGSTVRKGWLALDDSIQPKEEEETWFATYLDMMTLLLVLMIVMLAFSGQGDLTSADSEGGDGVEIILAQGDGTGLETGGVLLGEGGTGLGGPNGQSMGEGGGVDAENRLSEMGFSDLGDDIDVVLNDESVSFRINSEILFPSGHADLSLAGIGVLKQLVAVLKKNNYQLAVEGHTDSIPMRGRYPSNWELSAFRAGSVVRYFEANGISSDRLRAVGYADTRPLQPNDTAEGRAQNRRVELTMEIPK